MASQAHSAGETNAAAVPLGIYVHWPFCLSKCPYCDFNSHVREAIDESRWRRALLAELDHYAAATKGRPVASVFFGGGTPSLMAPETVAAVIERIGRHWSLDPEAEITLEANPTSVEAGRFAEFRGAGINRLSLGVQALDDDVLAFLGRGHSAKEALAAIALARRHFPRFSFDLIYARPEQSVAAWQAELARALEEGAAHLSLYQLTIEEGTAFHAAQRRGELSLPGAAAAAALYEATQAAMEAAGLPAYEISNHARPGAESRHNLIYWRYGDYLGIGPGAHGRLTLGGRKLATRQHRAPEAWLAGVERNGHATRRHAALAEGERLAELTMMGLRLAEGIARERFRRELSLEPETAFDAARLAALGEAGLIELDRRGLRATAAGRQRLNAVLGYLLAERLPG
ncbi:MAG: radical SAM family heme chaperone HemW [Rhodospirillales bacterium]|nr:radical SAM family heme chaperone HemW [Rhodospirillales bacterium]